MLQREGEPGEEEKHENRGRIEGSALNTGSHTATSSLSNDLVCNSELISSEWHVCSAMARNPSNEVILRK